MKKKRVIESELWEYKTTWTSIGPDQEGFDDLLKAWTEDFDWDFVLWEDYGAGAWVEHGGRIIGRTLLVFRRRRSR